MIALRGDMAQAEAMAVADCSEADSEKDEWSSGVRGVSAFGMQEH